MCSSGWEGVWPKEQAWGNSHEKAFDGSGEGHLFPDLLSFPLPPLDWAASSQDMSYLSYDVLHRAGP